VFGKYVPITKTVFAVRESNSTLGRKALEVLTDVDLCLYAV